ncbi:MAG: hypothetical protein CM1200mP1_00850 [Candidatus Neomarinimicrobiota bacterium]|nr:MAG: hypothetical protein CM1200mP1_00850 [Candidatus Neomarinimicrobiota bacterium]
MQLDSKTYTYSSKKSNNYILIFLGLVLLIVNFVLGFLLKSSISHILLHISFGCLFYLVGYFLH